MEKLGCYWSGVLISNVIFLSAHFLDHLVEGGKASEVIVGAFEFTKACQRKYSNVNFLIVVGMDATVTL